MQTIAEIIFWGSVLALAHSYLFYPLLVRGLARGKQPNTFVYQEDDPDLPFVSVLMSVYNEEKVIAAKLATLRGLHYPPGKLRFFIGSDCSDDGTIAIVEGFQQSFAAIPPLVIPQEPPQSPIPNPQSLFAIPQKPLQFINFPHRRGKPPVINDLAALALAGMPAGRHIFLLTDASVLLQPDTLYQLAKHFKNPQIGAVDAHMRSTGLRAEGISHSEDRYLSGEVRLKHAESLAWGKMIGPFGGCYALRAELFEPIPPNSLVDDFYLVFRVLEKGFQAINDLDAVCYEGATHRVADEYRRKKRIAAGSFQNLARFRRWVLPPRTVLGFAFFSHKVLRWFGGFFLALIFLSAALLAVESVFYRWICALFVVGIFLTCGLHGLLVRLRTTPAGPLAWVRHIYYFLAMNLALADGFFKWLRGIKSNTWQRTQRY